MEVVLLWLDDLDDILFSVALLWERLRRIVLQIGLAASIALAGSELSAIATQWAPAFSTVAAGSVGAWILGAALRAYYYRNANDSLTAA
jgi:CHASE2 domain-containing sensor protein